MGFHFNINRSDLLKAIGAQQNITSKKGTIAILSNILLEVKADHISLTGTDLEIGLKQTIPAEVFTEGSLTLPAKKLFEIARESVSNSFSFKEKDNLWVEIKDDSSQYRLGGTEIDEFPQFPDHDESSMVQIESSVLAEMIDKTIFSIALKKENMYTLTASLLKKIKEDDKIYLKIISSDGHRLSIMSREVDSSLDKLNTDSNILIPRKGVQEIRKFCENKTIFSLGIEEKQIVLKDTDSVLVIRLMDGDFPDFKGLLDSISKDNIIYIDRLRFLEGLKRINLFTEELFHAIKIEITVDKMILTSQNADFGSAKDEFTINYSGDPLSSGFNCRYFIESLQVMEGDTITVNINNQESPCILTSEDDSGFLSVIMPMKI